MMSSFRTLTGKLGIGLLLVSSILSVSPPPLKAVETNVLVRDPSTIVQHDGTYWVYGTGRGTQQFSSTDRLHWTNQGPALATAPAWVANNVPGNTTNEVWAPDVHFFNGKYYLYSSYSHWGSNSSGIGLATNDTLDPKGWVDQGLVIRSIAGGDVNAIDPCIFEDAEGKPWLSYGSYVSGIKLIQLDPATGKQLGDKVYSLATHPRGPGAAIEASYVYYHDGYYYLFVNWDACCAGAKSSYNIRMGRSKTVTGPYLDKTGKGMMQGGGTLFLAATYDNGSGRPVDDEVGPGHVGILHDTDGYWLSTHYEWARDQNGATTMNLNQLSWDTDGWPRPVLDTGPYKIVSAIATHDVLAVVRDTALEGAPIQTVFDAGANSQRWTLQYQGDGYYSIIKPGTNMALSVSGCNATAGAKIEISDNRNRDCQQWYLQQNDDGTYTLFPKSGNRAQALDVSGCSPNDGTPLEQWNANGLECQKWSLRLR
ncbi:MAG: family 43 glycosylhydrolase [Abitibacteriaceae bacterium]|nr:family 43 glycosylhydrolase [Abditibacteriaceae bacterium]